MHGLLFGFHGILPILRCSFRNADSTDRIPEAQVLCCDVTLGKGR